ncbi:MAG: hypothetical protein GC162_03170 [Planctomycetes bacterium]|nr:hypothetical protein [Planctomycetota bacterium]
MARSLTIPSAVLSCVALLGLISPNSLAQISSEEALRRLQEAKAKANAPEKIEEENKQLEEEAAALREKVEAMQKQLADLQAVAAAAGLPAEAAPKPAAAPKIQIVRSLGDLSALIPDSALPIRADRGNVKAYTPAVRDAVGRYFDTLCQSGELRIKATFTVTSGPAHNFFKSNQRLVKPPPNEAYGADLRPNDLSFKRTDRSFEIDTIKGRPYDACIQKVRAIFGTDDLQAWKTISVRDEITIDARISHITFGGFFESRPGIAISVSVDLDDIHILDHHFNP